MSARQISALCRSTAPKDADFCSMCFSGCARPAFWGTCGKHVQPQHAAACRSTRFLGLHIGVWKHAAACCSIQFFEFMCLSACSCSACTGDILPAPCLPSLFLLSCHESVICTNNIQSTVNTKRTTFPIRWENSAGEWERQPGTHARKAALQPPPICVEAPPQPNPTIIVNVPRPEPAEPECSQKRRFPYVE